MMMMMMIMTKLSMTIDNPSVPPESPEILGGTVVETQVKNRIIINYQLSIIIVIFVTQSPSSYIFTINIIIIKIIYTLIIIIIITIIITTIINITIIIITIIITKSRRIAWSAWNVYQEVENQLQRSSYKYDDHRHDL